MDASPYTLPWRGTGSAAAEAPLDVERLPRLRVVGLRPLKRWMYLGVFGEKLQLCVGLVRIAGAAQSFWALHDRVAGDFHERTALRKAVELDAGHAEFGHGQVQAELAFEPDGEPVAVVSKHGAYPIWTRKTPVRVRGRVTVAGVAHTVDAPGLLDESAGHHARTTSWSWSAGAGTTVDGRSVLWNLVDGMHDAETGSERTVWIDGAAQETPPVEFASDLSALAAGPDLVAFTAEAERSRHDRLLLVDSAYRQPFGRFTGTLPGGIDLEEGRGVMERHSARW